MSELAYYQQCLSDFQEALNSEKEMDLENEMMIRLLIEEIAECKEKIEELS